MDADSYAASMAAALDSYQALRPRSLQHELGVSSIGHCSSYAKWVMQGIAPTDAPASRQALMGTAIHDVIGAARKDFKPSLLIESPLDITLPSGVRIKGHADEVDVEEPSVTDYKTVSDDSDITALRRTGSTEQQRYQRHVYYLGSIQAGLVPAAGIVRNVWIDRAGQGKEAYVEQEPFDLNMVVAADRWLSDVAYAAKHNEEAPQDKHYTWCERFCEFFSHCRTGQLKPDLVVTDPEMLSAAALLVEGRAASKLGAELERSAKRTLEPLRDGAPDGDVAGYEVGNYRVRWQWINAVAGGYWKCAVSERVAA